MNIKVLMIAISILMITLVSAANPNMGTYKAGIDAEIKQLCFINGSICDFCNITSIDYPNGTRAVSNIIMTQREGDFNYTFTATSVVGRYNVNGYCTYQSDVKKPFVAFFDVTGSGTILDAPKSSYYIAIMLLLVFFFILAVVGMFRLPQGDPTDEFGYLIDINYMKYLKPVLFAVAWALLLAIVFTSSNVALSFFGEEMFGQLLFSLYKIMFWITIPMIFLWFIYIFVSVFRDREFKRMIERGIEVNSV